MAFKREKLEPKDRMYKLLRGAAPLSYFLSVRHQENSPLLFNDGERQRALRYASNQSSPFEDEQTSNAILQPVIFENGYLNVPANNPVLQEFLLYHPLKGKEFDEVDTERDADKELQKLYDEDDAISEIRSMDNLELEKVFSVMTGKNPSRYKPQEIRRDLILLAKKEPSVFLKKIKSSDIDLEAEVRVFLGKKLIIFKNDKREVYYNILSNHRKMMNVPPKEDPYQAIAAFFSSEEGADALAVLNKAASEG